MSYGKRDCEHMARHVYGESASVTARLTLGNEWLVEVRVRDSEPGRGFVAEERDFSLRKAYAALGSTLAAKARVSRATEAES